MKNYPFPFFGAGNATYLEYAEILIRFKNAPDDNQINEIIKSAPPPIKPGKNYFYGLMLKAKSKKNINMYIADTYDKDLNNKKENPDLKSPDCIEVKKFEREISPEYYSMKEIWERIEKFHLKNYGQSKVFNKEGASDEELAGLERQLGMGLPPSFKFFYKIHDGWKYCNSGFIGDFLSIKEIIKQIPSDMSEKSNKLCPFTVIDGSTDHYCLDMNPSSNETKVVFRSLDPEYIEDAADSFEEWIKSFVSDLESGLFEDESALEYSDEDFDFDDEPYDAFEADIERWLKEMHEFCHIEFVFRKEDLDADGIKLSDWHEQSLETIHLLMEKWNIDDYSFDREEMNLFKTALIGIMDYGGIKNEQLPKKISDIIFQA